MKGYVLTEGGYKSRSKHPQCTQGHPSKKSKNKFYLRDNRSHHLKLCVCIFLERFIAISFVGEKVILSRLLIVPRLVQGTQ